MNKKKIVICASVSFESQIVEWKKKLEEKGFRILKYPTKIKGDLLTGYNKEFSEHYDAISEADIMLVLNLDKNGISGYIGPGVFAEMAFALGLNQIFNKNIEVCYLNPIVKGGVPYSNELELWQNLGWIKQFNHN